jgi:tetratricopeptide (TPR) repeat protein
VRGLELIQRALKITPEHGLANYNRALLHEAMGEAEEALTCYHLALAAGYQPIACLSSMSTMLMTRNRNEEAKKMLVKGLTQFPKNPWLRFNLALAHRELKELDESREVLGLLHPELQGTDIFFQNKVRDVMKELGMPIPNEQSNDTASDNTVGE